MNDVRLLFAALVAGCSCSPGPSDGGDVDVGRDDAGAQPDAECLVLGDDRLCGAYCPIGCPSTQPWCNEYFWICQPVMPEDPRGEERCTVDLSGGGAYCYTGALCAVIETSFDPVRGDWMSGACVDESYCRWARDGEGPAAVRCHYSEGQEYEDGPPDQPCASGATPESPFCGGTCGDTCPADPAMLDRGPACVGISEERGFGVCTPDRFRCGMAWGGTACGQLLAALGAVDTTCACMLLEPALLPELPERGWAVARQSCLAYRDAFPGQVRCMDESWTEL